VGFAASIAVGIALLFSLINFLLGLDRIAWSRARPAEALDLIAPSALVTLTLLVLNGFWPTGPLVPQGVVVVTGLLAFLGFVTVRYRTRIITGLATHWIILRSGAHTLGERVLIVGAGEGGQFGAWLLRKGGFAQAFSIVGMVDDDPRMQGMRIDGCRVLGSTEDIPSLVERYDIGLVLFTISNIQPENQRQILSLCQATPARTIILPDIMEGLRAQFPLNGSTEDGGRGTGDGGKGSGTEIRNPKSEIGSVSGLRSPDTGFSNQELSPHPDGNITSDVAEEWLSELEGLVQAQDWPHLRTRIQEMKAEVETARSPKS
jgi:hypothetical protein